eukprot:RCo006662
MGGDDLPKFPAFVPDPVDQLFGEKEKEHILSVFESNPLHTSADLEKTLPTFGLFPPAEDLQEARRRVQHFEGTAVRPAQYIELLKWLFTMKLVREHCSDGEAAFVAMGGEAGGKGAILLDDLVQYMQDFQLSVDVREMLEESLRLTTSRPPGTLLSSSASSPLGSNSSPLGRPRPPLPMP